MSANNPTPMASSEAERLLVLGRLAAMLVHDINNLLGVVGNNAFLIGHWVGRHPAGADLQAPLAAIQRAVGTGSELARRAATLIQQSGGDTAVIDLAQFLPEVTDRLRWVVGPLVEVSVQVADGTRAVSADALELELALTRLALDAREATPGRGAWVVRAHNGAGETKPGVLVTDGRSTIELPAVGA